MLPHGARPAAKPRQTTPRQQQREPSDRERRSRCRRTWSARRCRAASRPPSVPGSRGRSAAASTGAPAARTPRRPGGPDAPRARSARGLGHDGLAERPTRLRVPNASSAAKANIASASTRHRAVDEAVAQLGEGLRAHDGLLVLPRAVGRAARSWSSRCVRPRRPRPPASARASPPTATSVRPSPCPSRAPRPGAGGRTATASARPARSSRRRSAGPCRGRAATENDANCASPSKRDRAQLVGQRPGRRRVRIDPRRRPAVISVVSSS